MNGNYEKLEELNEENELYYKKLILINSSKLLYLFICLLSFNSYAQVTETDFPTLVFSSTGKNPLSSTKTGGFFDELTKEIIPRIGYKLKFKILPSERSLFNLNNGVIDGDVGRIRGLSKFYNNIIIVPAKLSQTEYSAFSKKTIHTDSGWDSLKGKRIAYIRGWKILDMNVPNTAIVTKTKNIDQLIDLLEKDKIELFIYDERIGKYILDTQGIDDIKVQVPPLEIQDDFMYLNKKHKALIPLLQKALKDMKKDGSYNRLVKRYLNPYHNTLSP